MRENEIARVVVGSALRVHRALGSGLLESAYEAALAHELRKRGLSIERQVPVEVHYDGVSLDVGYRADMIVEGRVLLELKAVERLAPAYFKQTLSYVRFADLRLGVLLNFGAPLMRQGIARIINGL